MALYDLGSGARAKYSDNGESVDFTPQGAPSLASSPYQNFFGNEQKTAAPPGVDLNAGIQQIAKNAGGAGDLRSLLSGVFGQYGLDPMNPGHGLGNVDYFNQRANETNPNDTNYWTTRTKQEIEKALYGTQGNLIDTGAQTFSDPATAQWEQALQQIVGKLNQPYQAPGMDQLINYLQGYAQQLQGPAYTPQQTDLINTAAREPLTQQRDAAQQRLTQQLAARGLNPNEGIGKSQANQIERDYEKIRAQQEGQFATNAVNLDRQNRQMAAQILAQIPALQTQQFQGNENRALQGLSLLQQIPSLADRRLQLALQTMAPQNVNPASLFSNLNGFQYSGIQQQQQDQNYWSQIGQLIASLFT